MQQILIQLDTDPLPSSFDRVVAVDSGVDHIFSYGHVTPANVESLVHGAIFTRGPKDLKNTAIFIGGSRAADGEALLRQVRDTFFGPMSVSVMMDSNGSNTTAAAAVLAAIRHVDAKESTVTVLGGTGPVGQRAAQMFAGLGAKVRVVSRSHARAVTVCDAIAANCDGTPQLQPAAASDEASVTEVCAGADVVLSAGAAGVQFLSEAATAGLSAKVLIDLNAVPPPGIGVEVMDRGVERGGAISYGAIGVGGTKMKIHKEAVRRLFTTNDLVLDTNTIFEIGREVEAG